MQFANNVFLMVVVKNSTVLLFLLLICTDQSSSSRLPFVARRPRHYSGPAIKSGLYEAAKPANNHQKSGGSNWTGLGCGRVPLNEKQYNRSWGGELQGKIIQEDTGDFRILYGDDAQTGEWPWIVKIDVCDAIKEQCLSCTGSLLNSRWIVTAGHCFANRAATDEIWARLGLYDLLVPDSSSFLVEVDKIIVHSQYRELENDLALLRTKKPIEFGENVQPVCLIDEALLDIDKNVLDYAQKRKCYSLGYGMKQDLITATRLQKLQITARNASECDNDQSNNMKLRDGNICIGPIEEKIGSACRGDSGGPNQCYDRATNRWYLFGVVSYGPADCDRDESDRWLTVSVNLAKYRAWVQSIIADTN